MGKGTHPDPVSHLRAFPWRISLYYLLFGLLSIYVADHLLPLLFGDHDLGDLASTITDLLFVCGSALIIYLLARGHVKLQDAYRLDILNVQQRFKSLFEQARLGIFLVDSQGGFLEVNPHAQEMFGYSRAELAKLRLRELLCGADEQRIEMTKREISETGSHSGHWELRRQNGDIFQVQANLSLMLDGGILCILRDVTKERQAEIALRRSEARLRQAQSVAQLGSWEIDLRVDEIEVSEQLYRILGYETFELKMTRELLYSHVLPEDRGIIEDIRTGLSGKAPADSEPFAFRIRRRDGEIRHVCIRWQTKPEAPYFYRGIIQDVSESARQDAELKQLWKAVEKSHASIVVTDSELNMVYTNPSFSSVTGYSADEARGRKVSLIKSGYHPDSFYQSLWETLNAGGTWRGEFLNQAKDGRKFWEDVSISQVKDQRGKVVNYVAVKEDVSERKRKEESLSRALREFEAIFQNTSVGIIEVRRGGRIRRANNRFCAIVGKSSLEVTSGRVEGYFLSRADYSGFLRESLDVLRSGEVYQTQSRFRNGAGGIFWAELSGRAVEPSDLAQGLIWVIEDISERKKAEEAREDVERIMRHDLKSPLSGIIGLPEIMQNDSNLTALQVENLRRIRKNGLAMLEQINASLEFFRVESGNYSYRPVLFEAKGLLEETISNLAALARACRVEVKAWILGDELAAGPRYKLCGDRMLCRIVVSNLLKNAIEASPQNASVSIEVLDAPLQEIRVRNQGEVALEIRERLFDKYVTSGKKHGTGLGAYSARIMARAMGGDLELDCSVPGSTSLRFKLPKPS